VGILYQVILQIHTYIHIYVYIKNYKGSEHLSEKDASGIVFLVSNKTYDVCHGESYGKTVIGRRGLLPSDVAVDSGDSESCGIQKGWAWSHEMVQGYGGVEGNIA
jgi:hypothetical protein